MSLGLPRNVDQPGCQAGPDGCQSIAFDFAFQPIVSVKDHRTVAHEALARGPEGQPASFVLDQVNVENRLSFDRQCRARVLKCAASLNMRETLSINIIPNAVTDPAACVEETLRSAAALGFAPSRLIFELTEGERIDSPGALEQLFRPYRRLGMKVAIDDFGAGYAGLNLLACFQPDIVKIDIDLVRQIDTDRRRQIIVAHTVHLCCDLGVTPVAEGVETTGERDFLASLGIDLMQGYLFARPVFRALAPIDPVSWL